ncbi:MAG: multidrug ABC transporter ATP-binding protein [Lentisphaerae bacterium GWF2_52_8]|nr:MAG: multidrug ABC transporter ATP-binding protein [Lentisphaerae bacterium GWF2_52_8]
MTSSAPASDSNSNLAIDVRKVTKRFGGRSVVKEVSLQVRRGEIFAFLGPNGSGKTTFMRMLCGLLTPDGGDGTCLGHDILREQAAIKLEVGYMTQKFSFYEDLSIRENLDFVARLYKIPARREAVRRSLEKLGLEARQSQLAGTLSGGWKQRLALAACLIHEPKLLLLDEPTAGVDPKARRDFWDEIHLLAASGLTVLITTHYMDEAERCHRLAYLAYGTLLTQGSVEEVAARAGLSTWSVSAEAGTLSLAEELRAADGVEQVVPFGNTLHVSGSDAALLSKTVSCFQRSGLKWEKTESSLEDVFIHLMDKARDNYS